MTFHFNTMAHYFFYISYPIINLKVDFDNENHVNLIKWLQENPVHNIEYTPAQTAKARRLLKKAGLYVEYENGKQHTGEVSKYYIDVSLRKGKYETIKENFENRSCQWIEVEEIKL